jgi:hypothetical protein
MSYIQSSLGRGRLMEKEFKWSDLKSARLKKVRGVSFEEMVNYRIVDIKDHPNRSNQKIAFFEYKNQIWLAPFVENEKEMFLKTMYRSRKYTKIYKEGKL